MTALSRFFDSQRLLGLAAALSFAATAVIPKAAPIESSTAFLYPPKDAKYFTFGYNEVAADILWIRVIQDYDYCEQNPTAALVPHELSPDFTETGVRPPARCSNGWVYRMLDTVTELAPKFLTPFQTGGTILSVLVDDREGALKILEKGVANFPDDWTLHYRLGYHYMFEIKNPEKAAFHIHRAGVLGAPDWTIALSANLYSKAGKLRLGISMLEEALAISPDGESSARLRQRLAVLRRELAASNSSAGP